jgi:hypothetical protein
MRGEAINGNCATTIFQDCGDHLVDLGATIHATERFAQKHDVGPVRKNRSHGNSGRAECNAQHKLVSVMRCTEEKGCVTTCGNTVLHPMSGRHA